MVKEVTTEFQEPQGETQQHGCPDCFSGHSHFAFGIFGKQQSDFFQDCLFALRMCVTWPIVAPLSSLCAGGGGGGGYQLIQNRINQSMTLVKSLGTFLSNGLYKNVYKFECLS